MKVTNIKQQVKRGDRFSIYVDEKYSFSLGESELLNSGIKIGDEFDNKELEELKGRAEADKAMDKSLRFLAIRPRSHWEMQQYLKRKGYEEDLTTTILNMLSNRGLIDDEAFARSWANNRRLLKPISKRRLVQELRQKRVDSAAIEKVLQEDESSDIDTLKELVQKKRDRYKDDLKFMQFLARQGYNYQDIKEALKAENE